MRFNSRYGLFVWPTNMPLFRSREVTRPWIEDWLKDPNGTFDRLMECNDPKILKLAEWLVDNLTPTENAYDDVRAREGWGQKAEVKFRCEE